MMGRFYELTRTFFFCVFFGKMSSCSDNHAMLKVGVRDAL